MAVIPSMIRFAHYLLEAQRANPIYRVSVSV